MVSWKLPHSSNQPSFLDGHHCLFSHIVTLQKDEAKSMAFWSSEVDLSTRLIRVRGVDPSTSGRAGGWEQEARYWMWPTPTNSREDHLSLSSEESTRRKEMGGEKSWSQCLTRRVAFKSGCELNRIWSPVCRDTLAESQSTMSVPGYIHQPPFHIFVFLSLKWFANKPLGGIVLLFCKIFQVRKPTNQRKSCQTLC